MKSSATRAFDPSTGSVELFELLVMKTSGEAHEIVKSVEPMDGIGAWQKLHQNCSPTT